jgi:hypothetical protein
LYSHIFVSVSDSEQSIVFPLIQIVSKSMEQKMTSSSNKISSTVIVISCVSSEDEERDREQFEIYGSVKKKTRPSYPLKRKLEFIRYYKSEGRQKKVLKTAKYFEVARTTIREAIRNESRLLLEKDDRSSKTRLKRQISKERKPMYP